MFTLMYWVAVAVLSTNSSDLPQHERWGSGAYSLEIKRGMIPTPHPELIKDAEGVPLSPRLQRMLATRAHPGCEEAVFPVPTTGSVWWTRCEDSIPLAVTVNAEVVGHYRRMLRHFAESAGGAAESHMAPHASLSYEATVHQAFSYVAGGKLYENVFVVSLRLSLGYAHAGGGCSSSFSRERIVLFDADTKKLLSVFGDGQILPRMICI